MYILLVLDALIFTNSSLIECSPPAYTFQISASLPFQQYILLNAALLQCLLQHQSFLDSSPINPSQQLYLCSKAWWLAHPWNSQALALSLLTVAQSDSKGLHQCCTHLHPTLGLGPFDNAHCGMSFIRWMLAQSGLHQKPCSLQIWNNIFHSLTLPHLQLNSWQRFSSTFSLSIPTPLANGPPVYDTGPDMREIVFSTPMLWRAPLGN